MSGENNNKGGTMKKKDKKPVAVPVTFEVRAYAYGESMIYDELCLPNEREYWGKHPDFPKACPACGAMEVSRHEDGELAKNAYACGGGYSSKPQIQNHTNKWWGHCGKGRVDNASTGAV